MRGFSYLSEYHVLLWSFLYPHYPQSTNQNLKYMQYLEEKALKE